MIKTKMIYILIYNLLTIIFINLPLYKFEIKLYLLYYKIIVKNLSKYRNKILFSLT